VLTSRSIGRQDHRPVEWGYSQFMQGGRGAQLVTVERRLEHALTGNGGTIVVHGEAGSGRTWFCEQVARRAPPWNVTVGRGPGVDTRGWLQAATSAEVGQPRLFVLDDADELDHHSLIDIRTLAGLAHAHPVVVLLAAGRTGRLTLDPRHHDWIELKPLDSEELAKLVTTVSDHEPSGVAIRRIAAMSAGNVRTAVEISRTLNEHQLRSGEDVDDRLLERLSYTRTLANAMRELPERTRTALSVAAMARQETSATLVRCLELLGLTVDDLVPAEDSRLIVIDPTGVTFEHPLHHVAATSILPFGRRREVIAAIATTVALTDPFRSAWYEALDAVETDAGLANRLDRLAQQCCDDGNPSFAVDVWRRAASLTPGPPAALLACAARAAQIAGRLDDAIDAAEAVLASDPTPVDRADARRIEGLVTTWRGRPDEAWARLAADAEQLSVERPFEAAGLFLQATIAAYRAGQIAAAAHLSQRAEDLAEHLGPLGPAARAAAGYGRAMLGDPAGLQPIRVAADLHLHAAPFIDTVPALLHMTSWVGRMLDESGEHEAAAVMLDWTLERAFSFGATGLALMPRLHRAAARLRCGQIESASDDSAAASALAIELGQEEFRHAADIMAARVGALRGSPSAINDLHALSTRTVGPGRFESLVAAGQATLPTADADTAARALTEASLLAEDSGLAHPGHLPYESDLVEALLRCGQTDLAKERAWRQAAVAATWPDPLVKGLAERSLALVADDPTLESLHFRRALELFDAAHSPIEWARTELCRGERLRRRRRRAAAQVPLQRALATLRQVGARSWAALAEEELRACGVANHHTNGASPNDAHGLTGRERDIARSVAEGRTNRQVAAALHISPKTVENQLSRIYAKLGVHSRTELARLMHDLDLRQPVEPTPG
jgi:DNA-binding CsgD family transcriptional regulator